MGEVTTRPTDTYIYPGPIYNPGGTLSHMRWEVLPQERIMETEVRDPDWVEEYTADDKGRINLGQEHAGKTVKAAIGVVNDSDEEE